LFGFGDVLRGGRVGEGEVRQEREMTAAFHDGVCDTIAKITGSRESRRYSNGSFLKPNDR
jgi:hypothetical protein